MTETIAVAETLEEKAQLRARIAELEDALDACRAAIVCIQWGSCNGCAVTAVGYGLGYCPGCKKRGINDDGLPGKHAPDCIVGAALGTP